MFRRAKDDYEQHYIYSLLCNDEYGVCRYIKTKDLFPVKNNCLDENIQNNINLLSALFNHYKLVPKGLDLSHSGKFGYLYVLTNTSMPNIVKIGFTCGTAFERAKQLSTTSVPHPFNVRYLARVRKPVEVEKKVHALLGRYRVSTNREFFYVSLEQAVEAIETIATYIPRQNMGLWIR